ncbi:hypothetical protein B9Z55_009547 [Caenorhabditis nigoni]|uniref:Uncharacterized protein n=1 Tax=Caenorhabditis nigoni TaxID=1611254 RepID=A0A2G5UT96_9PELO|nr:hypothetical protein B9Z55_009547 [Caenorhabditis nigoni]
MVRSLSKRTRSRSTDTNYAKMEEERVNSSEMKACSKTDNEVSPSEDGVSNETQAVGGNLEVVPEEPSQKNLKTDRPEV